MENLPKISVLIPTLNAASVLEPCLKSITSQNYPKEKIETIISDGGSADATLAIAKRYGALIVENKLKTGESGKMVALKHATGDFVALIDSDNILPNENWFKQMIEPLLKHSSVVGSEPWSYTWREEDGFITRYCALIGMNDPFVHFLGNYDRLNLISNKWTEIVHEEKDFEDYLVCKFDKRGIPTIGANGTVFRTGFLKENAKGDYLFDIDIVAGFVKRQGSVEFIKVKNGIIHTYCESDIAKFARKQKRRVKDFLYHQTKKNREYNWEVEGFIGKNSLGLFKFIVSCVTVVPLLYQMIKGYIRKPDTAWLFHPLACEITLWEYGLGKIRGYFSTTEHDRTNWRQ